MMRNIQAYETPTAEIAFLEEADVIRTSETISFFGDEEVDEKTVSWKL